MNITERTSRRLILLGCILIYILLQITVILWGSGNPNNFNGVIIAIQFGICLVMIGRDNKSGVVASMILMGISSVMLVMEILRSKNLSPMPGLANLVIYIITILAINSYYRKREKEAVTDFITGRMNLRGLNHLLKEKIEEKRPFHLIYLELENFKLISDNYDHVYADNLLKTASRRIGDAVGSKGIIARAGGTEFAVILDGSFEPEEIANNMLARLREKISIEHNDSTTDFYLIAYAGISSYPKDNGDRETLIQYADIAMYQANKDKSQKAYCFTKEMEQGVLRQMEVEKLTKDALLHDYFYLVYQPQFLLDGKKLRGFETLIRMKTPDEQFVSPGEFIPVAEKSTLILDIDDYVLKRAMREFRDVIRTKKKDLIVSVNVSAKNIASMLFAERIEKLLAENDFPAQNLEIEITEYSLVRSVETTIDNIKKLRAMGVHVALDDFGTGYTSLSYLAQMPINLLKIDKSMIDNIKKEKKSRDFANTVIHLGHLMECDVISEGVEEEEQVEILSEAGCDMIQGFVWGKPLAYEAAVNLL